MRFGQSGPSEGEIRAGKALLAKAFKDLRKEGLIAKQNFMCCRSCASCSIWNDIDASPGKYKGAVYYCKQDGDNLRKSGKFYLGFGAADTDDNKVTALIGQLTKVVLEKHGLKVEWDGSAGTRILVRFPQA